MQITKFSKDGKRGFAVGTNGFTSEKIAAGALTVAAGLVMAGIGGLFGIFKKPAKSSRAKGGKTKSGAKRSKKKKPIFLVVLPFLYRFLKGKIQSNFIADLAHDVENADKPLGVLDNGIEIIDAIPIGSEEEVYDHV